MEFIDLKRQYRAYQSEIDAAIRRVMEHGQYVLGPEVAELEMALASYVGVRHCIGVASGTDSLVMALMALGIGPGDEVVTVPYTFFATAEAISLVGAKPVFVDIDPRTWCMDPWRLGAAITTRTRAVIPVSLYGQMADYAAIGTIAARHALAVIEDGAQSFGAVRNRVRSGAASLVGSTSFFPAKPLGGIGEGGALFTDDAQLADRMRAIRVHGSRVRHRHDCIGINGRLDTIQAAVLLAKLAHFPAELAARERVAARYDAAFAGLVGLQHTAAGNSHVHAQYAIRVAGRDAVAEALRVAGIPTAVHYPTCLHRQPAFSHLGYHAGDFPVAEALAREVLCLPMHPFLEPGEQDQVIEAVRAQVRRPADAAPAEPAATATGGAGAARPPAPAAPAPGGARRERSA